MKKPLLLLLGAMVAATTACQPTDDYAAVVNGHTISASVIEDELHAITSNPQYSAAIDSELAGASNAGGLRPGGPNTVNAKYVAQVLYNRIVVQLIEEQIAAKHLTVTPDQRQKAEQTLRSQESAGFESLAANYRDYLINREAELAAVMATRSTPEQQRAYYDANKASFTSYCVSHIMVATLDQANAIEARLASGEDFATLAKTESIDNQGSGSSAVNGGALGCGTEADLQQLPPAFHDAVLKLKEGQVSPPVQLGGNFSVIKLTTLKQPTFEDEQSAIQQRLSDPTQFFTEALSAAKIKVNPRFGEFQAPNASAGVTADVHPHPAKVLTPEGTNGPGSGAGFGDISGATPSDGSGAPADGSVPQQ